MKDVQTFNEKIDGFEISGVKITELFLNYHDKLETIVDVEGDLSEYSLGLDHNTLVIRTADNNGRVVRMRKNMDPVINQMIITVPQTFDGSIDINVVGSSIIINPSQPKTISRISLNGVDFSVNAQNIKASIEMNGVNSNMLLSNFQGRLEYSGVSNKAIIHNIVGDTKINIDGMSSKVTIYEETQKNHYNVNLSGLSSKLDYYGQHRTSMGNVHFRTQHTDDTPHVTIDGSGVSTRVIIES